MKHRKYVQTISQICSLSVILISGASIVGYLFDMEFLYHWTNKAYIPMALNTAICFLFVGFSIFFRSIDNED